MHFCALGLRRPSLRTSSGRTTARALDEVLAAQAVRLKGRYLKKLTSRTTTGPAPGRPAVASETSPRR